MAKKAIFREKAGNTRILVKIAIFSDFWGF